MNRQQPHRKFALQQRPGMVLVVTLAVVIALASMAVVFARSMRVEAMASSNRYSQAQARGIAHGAASYLAATQDVTEAQAVAVGEGAYWLLRPNLDEDDADEYSWGLIDEGARLNINTTEAAVLALLPGMTEQLAAAIVDWRDNDSEPGEAGGAEDDYYLMLEQSYQTKNAPFETLEELLLVRDMTPALLYGEDVNRNGILDPNEDDGEDTFPSDNADGRLDYGLIEYLTVATQPVNNQDLFNVNGEQGVNNNQEREQLREMFGETIDETRANTLANAIVAQRPHANLIDMFYKAEMTVAEFAAVADRLTFTNQPRTYLNINTAPRAVLLALPEMTEADADALIEYRRARGAEVSGGVAEQGTSSTLSQELASIAWITEALDREKAVAIGGLITTRSQQFTADIIATAENGRGFERVRVTFDATAGTGGMLTWRRMTHLGWPLGNELLGELRAGVELDEIAQADSGVSR